MVEAAPPPRGAEPSLGITFLADHWAALPLARRRVLLADMEAGGIDHVVVPDHLTFRDGWGWDGLVGAMSVLSESNGLGAYLGVHLLALRHPVVVARSIATVAQLAPGRLTFGIGVGGDDRHEVEAAGVDPKTRGARTDEALAVLRPLLAGETLTHQGEFFSLDEVLVRPAPDPAVPIIVGGRAEASLRRTARYGDGYLGIYLTASRYARAVETIAEEADAAGRGDVPWQHAMSFWCGMGATAAEAEAHVAPVISEFYGVPFDSFRKFVPTGPPEAVAEFLVPYWEAGCTTFNLVPYAGRIEAGIDAVIATWQHFEKGIQG